MSFLSRSDDSNSFVSSNYGSPGEGERTPALDASDDHGRISGSPPLKKLRRSDYNAFASLVNSLKHTRPTKALNERLLARKSTTPYRTAQPDLPGSPLVELPPALRPAQGGIHPLFDAQTHVDHLLDDRWPLYTQALGPSVDFAESIGTAASKMVRLRGMSNPYLRNRSRTTDEALHEGDDVIVPLPEDLVETTRTYLDKLLAGLAILRPSLTRPQRERLAPTGWEAVLQTAGLVKHGSSASERVSKLFGESAGTDHVPEAERRDISQVQQRLDMITSQRTKRKRPEVDEDAILAAVLKPKKLTKSQLPSAFFVHRANISAQIRATETQDRIEARREKKAAKANKAIEKREIKQAKALRKDEAHRERIAEEKAQIEVKKRLARVEKKRKREEERAQKEARRKVRAERRERKRQRAEARAERAQSRDAVTPQGDGTDVRAGKRRGEHGDTTQATSAQARRQKKPAKSHNAQMAESTAAGVTPRAEGGEHHVPAGSTRKTRRTAQTRSSGGAAATQGDPQHERRASPNETALSSSSISQARKTAKRKR